MDWAEYSKRRMSADERAAVMHLDMLSKSFEYCVDRLKDRLKGYRYAKRDLGMMKSTCSRIVNEALGDNPEDLAKMILRQSRDFRLGIERISPVRRQEECVMPLDDEWQLIHIVLESRCGLCMMSEGECRTCKIRKLLRRYCDEPDPGSLHTCGYQGNDLSDGDRRRMNQQERL